MLSSVRSRLTLWYAGVLALVLIVFAGGVYKIIERQAFRRIDGDLTSVLNVISLSLHHEIEEHNGRIPGEAAFREVMQTMHRSSFPRQGIVVYQSQRLVSSKPSYDGLVPPALPLLNGRPVFRTDGLSRVAGMEVPASRAAPSYRVIAVERMEGTLEELNSLRRTFYVSVPLTVILAALIGYLLARKSLAPVVAMSNAVDKISSSNLAARIEPANPHDELGKLAATFNHLLMRLEASFERQRQFMTDASHELRTPVSIARTAAQVNLQGPDRPAAEYREALGIVENQMSRLGRVVNDLFLLAKADSGVATTHRRPFSLDETVWETIHAARVLASTKQLSIECGDLAESPCEGDPDLIRQVLLLLLDNAVKYTGAGGTVRVGLKRLEQAYEVVVADTGFGIPLEFQSRIFERFYRVDKARSRSASSITGGAGLGLSIGRWIAEAHGGALSLRDSGPSGSTFVLTLPARQPASGALEASRVLQFHQ